MRFFRRHLSSPLPSFLLPPRRIAKTDPCFRGSYAHRSSSYSRRAGGVSERRKDTAILREKSRTPARPPSTPNAEKVFPTPRGFRRRWRLVAMGGEGGGSERGG